MGRPAQLESLDEARGRKLTLANLVRQGRMGDMELEEVERQRKARGTLASLIKLHGGDLPAVAQGMAEAGYADEAMALTEQLRAQARENTRDRLSLLQAGAMPVAADQSVERRDVLPSVHPAVPGAVLNVRRPLDEREIERTVESGGGRFYIPPKEELEERAIEAARRKQEALGFRVTPEMARFTDIPAGTVLPNDALPGVMAAVREGRKAEQPQPLTGEMREFAENFLPGYYQSKGIANPTAKDRMEAWFEFRRPRRAPVPGVDVPLPADVAAQRRSLNAARAQAGGGNAGLVQAVLNNPAMYDELTPSVKTAIAVDLAKAGFTGFGRRLSGSEIGKLSDGKSAIASLKDLREVLVANEKHIGPVAGLAALNPYSEARKAQADIDRVKQRVGKALEGGVLRKEDEEKYKKILATLTDTPETAIYKVDQILQNIEQDLNIYVEELRRGGRKVDSGPKAPAAASGTRPPLSSFEGK
jgi:hypothetical protein